MLGHTAALPEPAAARAVSMDQKVLGAQAVLEQPAHIRDVSSDTAWALLQTAGVGTQSSLGQGIFLAEIKWKLQLGADWNSGSCCVPCNQPAEPFPKISNWEGNKVTQYELQNFIFFFLFPKASSTLFYKL